MRVTLSKRVTSREEEIEGIIIIIMIVVKGNKYSTALLKLRVHLDCHKTKENTSSMFGGSKTAASSISNICLGFWC